MTNFLCQYIHVYPISICKVNEDIYQDIKLNKVFLNLKKWEGGGGALSPSQSKQKESKRRSTTRFIETKKINANFCDKLIENKRPLRIVLKISTSHFKII